VSYFPGKVEKYRRRVRLTNSQLYKFIIVNNYVDFMTHNYFKVTDRQHCDKIMIENCDKNSRLPSLREVCQRLGLVVSQRYQTQDIMRRCEVTGLPFQSVQLVLGSNGMLAVWCITTLWGKKHGR